MMMYLYPVVFLTIGMIVGYLLKADHKCRYCTCRWCRNTHDRMDHEYLSRQYPEDAE